MPLLFAVTLFLSAFLLFLVQPMVGKMVLPLMGGTPAVWNTCMVFFQASLLAGYAYSHVTTATMGVKRQAILHLAVLAVPCLVLPVSISAELIRTTAASEYPVFLLLKVLLLGVGLPFFAVATTGPLVQKWFAGTGHISARDPYFLYAASNLGSLLALCVYPAFVEPWLRLSEQRLSWSIGYGLFFVLVGLCALVLWMRHPSGVPMEPVAADSAMSTPVTWARRGMWIFWAFVPSSLLLGVTTYLSTDIAPIPLLWVVPLAIYLVTFILVFARRPLIPFGWMNRILPIAILMMTLVVLIGATTIRGLPVWVLLGLHLFAFFVAAMVAHGRLARDRPAPQNLTEFYLWLSVGGVLGGLFNALVAPILFSRIGLVEYPVALVLACLVYQGNTTTTRSRPGVWDFALPGAIGLLAIGLIELAKHHSAWVAVVADSVASSTGLPGDELRGAFHTGAMYGLPCILVFLLVDRPLRYALGIAALFAVGVMNLDQNRLHLERNFFGVLKVDEVQSPEGGHFRRLFHGSTIHGQERLDVLDEHRRHEPLTYYHRKGPIGRLFEKWTAAHPEPKRVAAVGLGTGSLAYYANQGDQWDFYEIDPAVERVARSHFDFLHESQAHQVDVILGDARLRLSEEARGPYNMIVLDAFSSDSIPMHLLTQEAMELYDRKLLPGGVLAFHISNRYLDLGPIIARVAESRGSPLVVYGWDDGNGDPPNGRFPSSWLVLARSDADLAPLHLLPGWKVRPRATTPLWTDDFSNLLSAWNTTE